MATEPFFIDHDAESTFMPQLYVYPDCLPLQILYLCSLDGYHYLGDLDRKERKDTMVSELKRENTIVTAPIDAVKLNIQWS
jgi:hypothetical protein